MFSLKPDFSFTVPLFLITYSTWISTNSLWFLLCWIHLYLPSQLISNSWCAQIYRINNGTFSFAHTRFSTDFTYHDIHNNLGNDSHAEGGEDCICTVISVDVLQSLATVYCKNHGLCKKHNEHELNMYAFTFSNIHKLLEHVQSCKFESLCYHMYTCRLLRFSYPHDCY